MTSIYQRPYLQVTTSCCIEEELPISLAARHVNFAKLSFEILAIVNVLETSTYLSVVVLEVEVGHCDELDGI